jgi:hypothetical protein
MRKKHRKALKKLHRDFKRTLGWPKSHYRLCYIYERSWGGWCWLAKASTLSGHGKTRKEAIGQLRVQLAREVVLRKREDATDILRGD